MKNILKKTRNVSLCLVLFLTSCAPDSIIGSILTKKTQNDRYVTIEQCINDIAATSENVSIIDLFGTCKQLITMTREDKEIKKFIGKWYYQNSVGSCNSIKIESGGIVKDGFCGEGEIYITKLSATKNIFMLACDKNKKPKECEKIKLTDEKEKEWLDCYYRYNSAQFYKGNISNKPYIDKIKLAGTKKIGSAVFPGNILGLELYRVLPLCLKDIFDERIAAVNEKNKQKEIDTNEKVQKVTNEKNENQ